MTVSSALTPKFKILFQKVELINLNSERFKCALTLQNYFAVISRELPACNHSTDSSQLEQIYSLNTLIPCLNQ